MCVKDEVDWTIPPEDQQRRLDTDERILEVFKDLKISYPAEIVGETGLSRVTVYDRLRFLRHQGKLERVKIGMSPPDELRRRLPELWEMGLKGSMIKRMSWYRVAEGKKKE